MKRYERYKPSGIEWIGEIPEHWCIMRLKYMTYNLDSKRVPLSSSERCLRQGRYNYYGATGIIDYVDDYLFDGEFILIGEDGAPFFEKNRDVAFIANGKFWVNNHAHILKTGEGFIPQSIAHQLNCVDFREYITGSTRDKLTQEELNEIKMVCLSEEEQRSIISYLESKTAEIDNLVAQKIRLINLLSEEKTAIINHAVTKGLNPDVPMKASGILWFGDIPRHWKIGPVKRFLDSFDHMRIPLSSEERGRMVSKDYDYYGASGIIDKVDAHIFDGDYILLGEDGANILTRSTALAFKASGKFWVNNHAHILRPKTGNIDYYVHLMEAIDYTIWVSGSAQPKLTAENLGSIPVPTPPGDEQDAIAAFINEESIRIMGVVSAIEKQIGLLQEYRTTLISEVVTGKIDVRGMN